MNLDVALGPIPYRRLASAPFILEWALIVQDDVLGEIPQDISDIVGVTASALQLPPRGVEPPAATVWTLDSGASFYTDPSDDVTPVLRVFEPTGLPAGVYQLLVSFTTDSGYVDWALETTLELTVQPS